MRPPALPAFHDDPAECKRCPSFGATCNPPLSVKGAEVLLDPELRGVARAMHALKPIGREWSALDADLKKHLRGVESAIAGSFVISGRWSKSSRGVPGRPTGCLWGSRTTLSGCGGRRHKSVLRRLQHDRRCRLSAYRRVPAISDTQHGILNHLGCGDPDQY